MTFHEHALRPSDFSVAPAAAWNRTLAEEADLDQAVELLRRRYPGLCIYWGEYTGSLWALLPDQLVEAKTAPEIARRLDAILERPNTRRVGDRYVRRERPASRAADGTWAVPERNRRWRLTPVEAPPRGGGFLALGAVTKPTADTPWVR